MLKRFVAPEPVCEVSLMVHYGFVRITWLTALRHRILVSVLAWLHASKATEKVYWCKPVP